MSGTGNAGHSITLDGNTVLRDGRAVKIVFYENSRDLKVGCTYVTRAALNRLVALANSDGPAVRTIQEGAE